MGPYERSLRHAEALLRAGNSRGAIEPLRDALSMAPDQAYPHLLLAGALRGQRRLAGARHEAGRAIELEPTWAPAHLELAQVLEAGQEHKITAQLCSLDAQRSDIGQSAEAAAGDVLRVHLQRVESVKSGQTRHSLVGEHLGGDWLSGQQVPQAVSETACVDPLAAFCFSYRCRWRTT